MAQPSRSGTVTLTAVPSLWLAGRVLTGRNRPPSRPGTATSAVQPPGESTSTSTVAAPAEGGPVGSSQRPATDPERSMRLTATRSSRRITRVKTVPPSGSGEGVTGPVTVTLPFSSPISDQLVSRVRSNRSRWRRANRCHRTTARASVPDSRS
jgi:hypothetical protein